MVKNYFNGMLPTPKKIDTVNLIALNTDCAAKHIDYLCDETSPNDNTDIDVQLNAGAPLISGKYTVTYFKGILKLFAPTEFWFSKAVCPITGKKTLVFMATKNSDRNNPVYCGDLSGLIP